MVGWVYSLSIIFIFQSIETKPNIPSLVGLMAEVNDPTSVFNNPGALGFLRVDNEFEINLLIDLQFIIESIERYSYGEISSSFPQITLKNDALVSFYTFGFYFAMRSRQDTWFPVIARRFGNFSVGVQLVDNNLRIGSLLVMNDKFRLALSGNVIYDSLELRGRGGFIYQPSDWYYLGFDVFPYSKRFKIANSFLCHRFGLDKVCMGLEMNNGEINPEWEIFIQGIFSFKYLQLAVGWNSGIGSSPEALETLSNLYEFNIIGYMHWGF
jgi:hypothetical protein